VGDTVLPFRTGMFGIALRTRVPIVPVALRYDPPSLAWVGDATFLPHYLGLAGRRRARAVVRIGVPTSPTSAATSRDLAAAARGDVLHLMREAGWPSSPSSTT